MNTGWRLKALSVTNLFRYSGGPHHLDFEANKNYLICGVNQDDLGMDSNGSGKSSIPDAISFALFGQTPKSKDLFDIITTGEDRGIVELTLSNGKEDLKISRSRHLTKKATKTLHIFSCSPGREDSHPDLDLRTDTLTQQALYSFFGLDSKRAWDDYLSKVYFSTESSKGLLSSEIDPIDRQRILERFFSLDILDAATKIAKDTLRENQSVLSSLQKEDDFVDLSKFSGVEKELSEKKKEEALLNVKRVNTEDIEVTVADYYEKVTNISRNLSSLKEQKIGIDKRAANIKEEYQKAKLAKVEYSTNKKKIEDFEAGPITEARTALSFVDIELQTVAQQRNPLDVELNTVKSEIKSINREIRSMEEQLEHAKHCPSCNASLMIDEGGNIASFDEDAIRKSVLKQKKGLEPFTNKKTELEIQIEILESNKTSLLAKRAKIALVLAGVEQTVKNLRETLVQIDIKSIISIAKDIETEMEENALKTKEGNTALAWILDQYREYTLRKKGGITVNTETINKDLTAQREELKRLSQEISSVKSDIAVLESRLSDVNKLKEKKKALQEKIEGAKKKVTELLYWSVAFNDIKMSLLNSYIPNFELMVNDYLSSFGVRERVRFLLNEETKTGTTKPGFNIQVWDGANWRNYESLSKGEKSRVMIASGYSLHNLSNRGMGNSLEFICVDEILDNLDETGIEFFFEVSGKLPGQKLIITHSKPDESRKYCDGIIVATRKNDCSTFRMTNAN